MRRCLVLTDEAARHPFRASLPPHVCAVEDGAVEDGRAAAQPGWRVTLADVRGFASAYVACVVGIVAFIA